MQSNANARIQLNAKHFLTATGTMERPTSGKVAQFLGEEFQTGPDGEIIIGPNQKPLKNPDGKPTKGLNAVLRALGEAIGEFQDISMKHATADLLERLEQLCEKKPRDKAGFEIERPYNPADKLLQVAFAEDGPSAAEIQELRAALKYQGRPIFDKILELLTDIAENKKLEIEGGKDEITGEGRTDKPKDRGPQGWRESLKDDQGANVDDKAVRESAQSDKTNPPVDDKAIRDSAAGGNEFRPDPRDSTEYEKGEGKGGDAAYFSQLSSEQSEVLAYYRLAKQLKEAYDKTLGTCLEPDGIVPGGPK